MPLGARTGNGDYAYRQLNGLFQRKTLPNLFDLCGPFQIDGNFGTTAGICELLVQSHELIPTPAGEPLRLLNLLPALPAAWPAGSVSGLCARDGFEVDLAWDAGVVTRAVIHSKLGKPCLLRTAGHELKLVTESGKSYAFDGQLHPVAGN